MCGICGFVYNDGRSIDDNILKRMCDRMKHRGPDDHGYYLGKNVGLGIRRLSIIDVAGGHQPIHNEDKTIWIVFNGEIYNYTELRSVLRSKGHVFYTQSDTECILHLYEEYGNDCVSKLRGMFAFAIWDERRDSLFIARDRLGIKPLYYVEIPNGLIFGSEVKAILQHPDISVEVNRSAIHDYLTFLYVPAPDTMFQGIYKLPAAHWLRFESGRLFISRYWDLHFRLNGSLTEDEYANEVRERLKESVKMRLMSEVPLGAFLSGGIDSSGIVAMMSEVSEKRVSTFSIGFCSEGLFNEIPFARVIAEKYDTDHHEFIVEPKAVDLIPKVVEHLDEPIADASAVLNYLVAQLASQHVTVALSGIGGDEVFAGYRRYSGNSIAEIYRKLPKAAKVFFANLVGFLPASQRNAFTNYSRLAKKFIAGANMSPEESYLSWNSFFTEEMKENLYSDDMRGSISSRPSFDKLLRYFQNVDSSNFLDKVQYVDLMTYLVEDLLPLGDKMSMAHSLEVRVPFLDHELVEFAATIPPDLRMKGRRTKYILKKALSGDLPKDILTRRKQGFSIPIDIWLRGELSTWCCDLLSRERIESRGYFRYDSVLRLMNEYNTGKRDFSQHIWSLLLLEIWHMVFVDKEGL